ncbi:hypothetical protein M0R45_012097 [Rubus argutus]|uniref:SWIM-type domain-containing protein n=1 Tax=Rubus argutus TaxID=59490 RepID=A0AAW1YEW2_RUBAR
MPRWRNRDKPFEDRVDRAIHQHIRLLHRCGSRFFVLGHTRNVYTVTLSTESSCSCPDVVAPCKHMLFVYLQVLGVCVDTSCVRRSTLHPSEVSWLLGLPTSRGSLAKESVRQWFRQLHCHAKQQQQERSFEFSPSRPSPSLRIEDGSCCPVCLDEIGRRDKVVACWKCRNPMHEECFFKWERSTRKKAAHCTLCRAKWSTTISR